MRKALAWLVVVIGLVTGLVIADVWVRGDTERRFAAQLQQQLHTPDAPVVRLEGWPMLWQALTRRFEAATVQTATATVPIAGRDVTFADLVFTARGIDVSDEARLRLESVHGSGRLPYDQASAAVGLPVTFAAPDRLEVEQSLSVRDPRLKIALSAVPTLDAAAQTVSLQDLRVTLGGFSASVAAVPELAEWAARPIPIQLPGGLRLTALRTTEDGLRFDVSGTGVDQPR